MYFNLMVIALMLNGITTWQILSVLQVKRISVKKHMQYSSGGLIGLLLSFMIRPISFEKSLLFGLFGMMLSQVMVLFYLIVKQENAKSNITRYYVDGTPPKFFITGDKHRNFEHVKDFCRDMNTRRMDVLIILGDAGFNYYEDERDDKLKQEISQLNITLFCLHGNKEKRPQHLGTYGVRNFYGGKVYYEPKYPRILFAIDGEIYTFEGKKYMVVGGAHSVDKERCLEKKLPFWDDEMPNDLTKATVESALNKENNSVHGMMTHTCPLRYLPTEMFVSTRQAAATKKKRRKAKRKEFFKPDIDRSTEEWLEKIENQLDYKVWFCGHYHIDKAIDKIRMMHQEIRPLHREVLGEEG